MDSRRSTQAEDAVAMLQKGARSGVPVLIPGALEVRAGRQVIRPAGTIAALATSPVPAAAVYDRERLERQREGGGAPSERMDVRHRSILARLYDLLVGRNR
jgi:hypothetical protein